jgi:hypothetical protein
MSKRAAKWVTGNMSQLAGRQAARVKPYKARRPVRPSEQIRRYLAGEERWRLEQGLISPEEWQRYEQAMISKMQQGG